MSDPITAPDAGSESVTIQTPGGRSPGPKDQKPKKHQKRKGAPKEVTDSDLIQHKSAAGEGIEEVGSDRIEHKGAAGERVELEVAKELNAKTIKNLKVIEGTYIGKDGELVVYQHKHISAANAVKAIRGYIGEWATALQATRLWKSARSTANIRHKGELHFGLPESIHDPSIVKELRFTVAGKKPATWAETEKSLREYFEARVRTKNKRMPPIEFDESITAEEALGK